MKFFEQVKNLYEEKTGEMIIPMEEWDVKTKEYYDICEKENAAEDFVYYVLQ